MKQKLLIIIIAFILCIPVLLPLFSQGFFLSDDGEWMVIRFSAFYQALRDGQFPVRFLGRLNFEYGYPVANFLYPGFMYLGVPFHILGFGFAETIKIILGSSMVLSLIFSYLWLSKFFNKSASLIGALVYVYSPYHLFDLYKRGSVGEIVALAIIPFILWNVERRSTFFGALGIGLLILSHNSLALLFMGVLFLYMVLDVYVSESKKQLLSNYVITILFGFGISFFFWFPAIYDLRYTVFSSIKVAEWDRYFVNLDLVGIITPILFLAVSALFLMKKISISKHRLTILFLCIGLLSLLLSLSISESLWKILPISFIQFPFRLLSLVILCSTFLTAFFLSEIPKHMQKVVGVGIVFLLFFSSQQFMTPQQYFNKGDSYYATNVDTTTVKNEYMPIWVKKAPNQIAPQKIVSKGSKISQITLKTNNAHFISQSKQSSVITYNTIFFPGWIATIDGKETTISYDNEEGIINISVPPGNHVITFSFQETPVRFMSDILSLISIGMLLIYVLKDKILKVVPR